MEFDHNDAIAVIAPHPDDECLGASSALLTVPDLTDVYVLTDGSHGSKERSFEEEARIRRAQFDAEMAFVKPRRIHWLGYEDTTLSDHPEAADSIDFTKYTKIFLPWHRSPHPDHRAASVMCCETVIRQKASCECYSYEITNPFYNPTHFVDITDIIAEKNRLIDFHQDQADQKYITISLNAYRGAIHYRSPSARYLECYLKVDPCKVVREGDEQAGTAVSMI